MVRLIDGNSLYSLTASLDRVRSQWGSILEFFSAIMKVAPSCMLARESLEG